VLWISLYTIIGAGVGSVVEEQNSKKVNNFLVFISQTRPIPFLTNP
jgi:hypothetical protein